MQPCARVAGQGVGCEEVSVPPQRIPSGRRFAVWLARITGGGGARSSRILRLTAASPRRGGFNGNARGNDERRDAVFNVFVAGPDRDSNTAAGVTRAYKTRLVGLPRDQQP